MGVSKKLVSLGLSIAVASSSYPFPSSCCSRCFPCCATCSNLVPSRQRSHQHSRPRQLHSHMIATWGLQSSGGKKMYCCEKMGNEGVMPEGCQEPVAIGSGDGPVAVGS